MRNRTSVSMWIAAIAACWLGCATTDGEEPLPAHPFPSWVGQLESGSTPASSVRQRFGAPDEIEQSARGGEIWRYTFREVHWPEEDPMRPVVGADGTVGPREPSTWNRIGKSFRRAGAFMDWLFFYPPRQPRPPRTRRLPATVHELELVFELDGTLRRFHYVPAPGTARVPFRS